MASSGPWRLIDVDGTSVVIGLKGTLDVSVERKVMAR